MKYLALLLFLMLTGCSHILQNGQVDNQENEESPKVVEVKEDIIADTTANDADTGQTSNSSNTSLSKDQVEEIITELLYFGTIGEKNDKILGTKINEENWIITLTSGNAYTMDKDTGLIYCAKPRNEPINCDFGHITYIEGAIILDIDGFSCFTVDPSAAGDGSDCREDIILDYVNRKSSLLSKKLS